MKNLLTKVFNKKKYIQNKILIHENYWKKKYLNIINPEIKKNKNILKKNKEITFLHSGQIGDIINSLATIKEISKTRKCNLCIEVDKPIPSDVYNLSKNYSKFFISHEVFSKLFPLLKFQKFLNKVEIYKNQKIDIDLNFFREMYPNYNIDSVRWYFHLTGIHSDLSKPYISSSTSKKFKNCISIMRSKRRQNNLINYKFLNKFNNVFFLGLKDEYKDLKKQIKNLKFHDCKDFLELSMILMNSKIFIGNLSFGYALAEALKIPRLLESGPNFPLVYPNGHNAYDFYHQEHFEDLFQKICGKN